MFQGRIALRTGNAQGLRPKARHYVRQGQAVHADFLLFHVLESPKRFFAKQPLLRVHGPGPAEQRCLLLQQLCEMRSPDLVGFCGGIGVGEHAGQCGDLVLFLTRPAKGNSMLPVCPHGHGHRHAPVHTVEETDMMRYALFPWLMFLSSLSMLSLAHPALGQPRQWSARSGVETGVLVELYTSEG
jgi:hypothetical protein